jgi:hypothetical protein
LVLVLVLELDLMLDFLSSFFISFLLMLIVKLLRVLVPNDDQSIHRSTCQSMSDLFSLGFLFIQFVPFCFISFRFVKLCYLIPLFNSTESCC